MTKFPFPWRATAVAFTCLFLTQITFAQKKSKYWSDQSGKAVEIPGATRVGAETCTGCHAETANNFRHAFHAQQGIECEDCHGAGSLHAEAGGDPKKIVSFKKRTEKEANGVCLSCHGQDETIRNWVVGPHEAGRVRCTDCHEVHSKAIQKIAADRLSYDTLSPGGATAVETMVPEDKVFLQTKSQGNESCLKCHASQRGELSLPYHHPLREGKVGCDDCHNPHGGPAGNNLKTATVNPLCLSCHAQYRGPFTYQHPPVSENCMLCHSAHGSANTNLLNVSQPALCIQCHTAHHNGANLPLVDRCTQCHGSIHGTDVSSATGGSVFIDKPAGGMVNAAAIHAGNIRAAHPSMTPAMAAAPAASAGLLGPGLGSLLAEMGGSSFTAGGEPGPTDTTAAAMSAAGSYRLLDPTGYRGRVGEYDSLQQSGGGDVETAYVSMTRNLSAVSRATILTGDDYQIASQFNVGETFRGGFDIRSFRQQQDNYPFFADIISPDIVASRDTPVGSVFGITRRMGNANARVKLPKLPVHLFVKGEWQAREGTSQSAWYDMGGDTGCNFCHFTSQFQPVNYTNRTVGGGAEANLGPVTLMWEHDYNSFNDRLQFPMGAFGATLGFPLTPDVLPAGVPNTPAGTYPFDTPSSSQASTDTVRLSWAPIPQLIFNGQISYTRARDLFTRNAQNSFDSYLMLNWRPIERLRLTASYGQQNLLNDFTPAFALFGNVSYHRHSAGLRATYDLTKRWDVETRYERDGITRSNSALWPQFYSPDNTDLLEVVPASFSNTIGEALRYHGGGLWSARAGYEWTGTHDPGYLTVPQSNNRIFTNLILMPTNWLTFSNDANITVQNAFAPVALPNTPGQTPGLGADISGLPPDFQRRYRFYSETLVANMRPQSDWNLQLGYSYQQNNLNTYMAIQNDSSVGYVLDEPFVPYRQISQTYWAGLGARFFHERFGINGRVTYNSARSGLQPDLNPADAAQLGNAALIQGGVFDPVLFGQALSSGLNGNPNQGALSLAATQISQVIVPEWIGQAKIYYRLPKGFDAGLLIYYGSYRDELTPTLNGVLRTFNIYVRRAW
ncbi:MAG: cytochrome c3 family protein [Candidatus Acidiferrales bacterium]